MPYLSTLIVTRVQELTLTETALGVNQIGRQSKEEGIRKRMGRGKN